MALGLFGGACSETGNDELLTPAGPPPAEVALDKLHAVQRPEDHPLADRWIVVLEDDFEETETLANRFAAEYEGETRHLYRHVFNGFAAMLPRSAIDRLLDLPQVKYVESDSYDWPAGEEPLIDTSPPWHLDRIDQRAHPLDSLYTRLHTGKGINIYVVDSGIDSDHPEFTGRVYWGMTAIGDGRGIEDCLGHGTQVAGIAAGATMGVANESYLTIIRINDCTKPASTSDVIKGFDWIAADDYPIPSVVNYSYSSTHYSKSREAAIQSVIDDGISVIVSAGNDGEDACGYYPNDMEDVISVGATSRSDAIWQMPHLLGDGRSNSGPCLDIWAPGEAITTADLGGDTTSVPGTSFAAPQVAGTAALLLQDAATRTPAQISSTLDYLATRKTVSGALHGSPNLFLYAPYLYSFTGGPTEVESGSSYEWYPVLYGGGGYSPDSYEWWYTPEGGSASMVATTEKYTRHVKEGHPDFTLSVVSTIGSITDTAKAKAVTVDPFEDPCLTNPNLPCTESATFDEGG